MRKRPAARNAVRAGAMDAQERVLANISGVSD
jgi:hypothetical protein